jgi:hypothetical protein
LTEFLQKSGLMNFFIALGVVCLAIGIFAALIAGIFKILIFRDFKLDQVWFDYGPRLQHLNFNLRNEKDFFRKALYSFFSYIANFFIYGGLLMFLIGYLLLMR